MWIPSKKWRIIQNPPRFLIGIPGAIRTRDLPLRRRMLYPAELRRHMGIDRMLSTNRMNIADVFYRKMRFLSREKICRTAETALRYSDHRDKILFDFLKTVIHKAKVLFFVIPQGVADTEFCKGCVDILQPADLGGIVR